MSAMSTIYQLLKSNLNPLGKVYAIQAPENENRPYTVFFASSAENTRQQKKTRVNALLVVKCVADTLARGFEGADALDAILHGSGALQSGAIVGDSAWRITTITQVGHINTVEQYEGVEPIYHVGYEYEIVMEAI